MAVFAVIVRVKSIALPAQTTERDEFAKRQKYMQDERTRTEIPPTTQPPFFYMGYQNPLELQPLRPTRIPALFAYTVTIYI